MSMLVYRQQICLYYLYLHLKTYKQHCRFHSVDSFNKQKSWESSLESIQQVDAICNIQILDETLHFYGFKPFQTYSHDFPWIHHPKHPISLVQNLHVWTSNSILTIALDVSLAAEFSLSRNPPFFGLPHPMSHGVLGGPEQNQDISMAASDFRPRISTFQKWFEHNYSTKSHWPNKTLSYSIYIYI